MRSCLAPNGASFAGPRETAEPAAESVIVEVDSGVETPTGEPPAVASPVCVVAPPAAVGATPSSPALARPAHAAVEPAEHASVARPPLEGQPRFVALALEGFAPAVVALPLGATEPRPVVVAAHGNYDRPEWQCAEWARIVGDGAFVLCPRGVPRPDSPRGDGQRFTYRDGPALEREVAAGVAALAARFGAAVRSERGLVWAGFSWGAFLGAGIALADPQRFPRLALVEGGHDPWSAGAARAFAAAGGRRVLFVCGSMGCVHAAVPPAARLADSGVAIKIELADGIGHGYGGRVSRLIAGDLAWLVD